MKTVTLKPAEIAVIRDNAKQRVAIEGATLARMEIGTRVNIEIALGDSINVLLVSRDPNGDWNDTDLSDFRPWAEVRKPIPLTPSGRAVIDFYCFSRDDLICNVQAEIDATGLLAVHADGLKNVWRK